MSFLFQSAPRTLAESSAAGKPVIRGVNLPCNGRRTRTFDVELTMYFPLDPQQRKGIARRRQPSRSNASRRYARYSSRCRFAPARIVNSTDARGPAATLPRNSRFFR